MNRRTFLSTGLALVACTSGCLGQSESANPDATTTPESTSPDVTGTVSTPATEKPTPTCEPSPTTTRNPTNPPELNRTPRAAAFQWDLGNDALGGGDDSSQVVLLTTDDWQDRVNEAALSPGTRAFLVETDFEEETVVAFQIRLSAGLDRLLLHSVEGVGTQTIAVTVEVWESGSGLNNAPTHLLLVRVPNRGTEPTSASVTSQSGGTVSTGE